MSYSTTIPPDEGRLVFLCPWKEINKIKLGSADEYLTSAFFHFSFPYVNIVVLEEYHFSRMREYVFFPPSSFMPRFSWNSYREWHTRGALADSESRANKTPLMKRAKEPLMSRKFMRLIPAALCSSRPSTYGLSRQIRNGTCTPPLFWNNQHLLFPLVCLPHNIFVPLCTAHWGGGTELSRGKRRYTLIDIRGKSK